MGSNLGSLEIGYTENEDQVDATLETFSHCRAYKNGVYDGYKAGRGGRDPETGLDNGPIGCDAVNTICEGHNNDSDKN